jgi:bifunctional DNA-binding transcriptional regulator/antitoxin component of YhaV-PrlF toxin-antitoxin module
MPVVYSYLFVGEKRSELAIKMNVSWVDGRLSAKQLFDALDACGIPRKKCNFLNWWPDRVPHARTFSEVCPRQHIRQINNYNREGGWGSGDIVQIVAMGSKVQKAMSKEGIDFIPIVHPAARGTIRKKENYAEHIRQQLIEKQGIITIESNTK